MCSTITTQPQRQTTREGEISIILERRYERNGVAAKRLESFLQCSHNLVLFKNLHKLHFSWQVFPPQTNEQCPKPESKWSDNSSLPPLPHQQPNPFFPLLDDRQQIEALPSTSSQNEPKQSNGNPPFEL
jgi:hypothetical protein